MFWYKKKFFLFMLGYICSLVLSANIFSALPAWRIHRDRKANEPLPSDTSEFHHESPTATYSAPQQASPAPNEPPTPRRAHRAPPLRSVDRDRQNQETCPPLRTLVVPKR